MEVYAGMVDAMDTHIGRLMNYLQSIGEYENTIFIFTSDNGAEGSPLISPTAQSPLDQWFETVGYETGIETLENEVRGLRLVQVTQLLRLHL